MSKMNNNGGSVAPKERISVRYTPKVDGVAADIELPLNLLITGNLKGNQITRRWMSELPLLSTAITSTQSFQKLTLNGSLLFRLNSVTLPMSKCTST